MQQINKRARLTLYLLLGIELMLVSVYYSWGRTPPKSAHRSPVTASQAVSQPASGGM
ncbi:MAG TPA: hypothetical protein VN176_02465 [Verrucomicrobiae bacterium]|nr:hypothetical protein [Verrucomicrobiae bacterium]